MNSMKAVINKGGRASEAPESSSNKAVKDGSAHPHAGSDARVRFCNAANYWERRLTCTRYHISVLSHSHSRSSSWCITFTYAQSHGSLQTSFKFSRFWGREKKSGELIFWCSRSCWLLIHRWCFCCRWYQLHLLMCGINSPTNVGILNKEPKENNFFSSREILSKHYQVIKHLKFSFEPLILQSECM